jgi:hypothetical protein
MLAALAIALALTTGAAHAAPTDILCPGGYDVMTLDYALVRYAGFFTPEEIAAGFDWHDVNDNGIVCRKVPGPDPFYPFQVLLDDLSTNGHHQPRH